MNLSIIDKQYIKSALNGDMNALEDAFDWSSSPQGHDFWEAQYESGQLTTEGRAALEAMLND